MKFWHVVFAGFLNVLIAASAQAQEPLGDWEGSLTMPNAGKLRIVAFLRNGADGRLSGTLSSPDQFAAGIPLTSVKAEAGILTWDVPSIHASYRGAWDATAKRWKGNWTQSGSTFALDLSGVGPDGAAPEAWAELSGDWYGLLDAGAARLRLVFHIDTSGAKTLVVMDSIDQSATGIPVGSVRRSGMSIRMDLPSIRAAFEAVLATDKQSINGVWMQGGVNFPLVLSRKPEGVSAPAMRRPQMPVKPYPYREEDVAYENPAAHVRLAGTLTLPPGPGPFPAVLLIAGSGPLDRDETIFGHKGFLVLSDHLTRLGIAVLRVDKRGVGKSTGLYAGATTLDFASDAEAGFAFLAARPEIDAKKIGLIGHSEGGLIAPLIANRQHAVAFVVLLAAPALPGDEMVVDQASRFVRVDGWQDERVQSNAAMLRKVTAALMTAPSPSEGSRRAQEIMRGARDIHGLSDEAIAAMIRQWSTTWFRFFLSYDPMPALRSLKAPVLAITGSNDLQVAPSKNLPPLREALARNQDAEISELPRLNHLFQTADTGAIREYGQIEETFAPSALALISKWIAARVK